MDNTVCCCVNKNMGGAGDESVGYRRINVQHIMEVRSFLML